MVTCDSQFVKRGFFSPVRSAVGQDWAQVPMVCKSDWSSKWSLSGVLTLLLFEAAGPAVPAHLFLCEGPWFILTKSNRICFSCRTGTWGLGAMCWRFLAVWACEVLSKSSDLSSSDGKAFLCPSAWSHHECANGSLKWGKCQLSSFKD